MNAGDGRLAGGALSAATDWAAVGRTRESRQNVTLAEGSALIYGSVD